MEPESTQAVSCLVVDDDPLCRSLLCEVLGRYPARITQAEDCRTGLEAARKHRPRIVFLDLMLPDGSGLELLEPLHEIAPAADIFLTTAHYSTESAVEAIQRGASDYLNKPFNLDRLVTRLDQWFADEERLRRSLELQSALLANSSLEGIVGLSPKMTEVFSQLRRIAPHFASALIVGDSGTGKELAARALHHLSGSGGPFVVCNCAAVPETLFESELFGYVKGAFTGANSDRQGYIQAARGGTLFLDEIGELPLSVQPKLLRFLQSGEVQRVGSRASEKIDLRVISATNRDLKTACAEKVFREDLFFRLAMIQFRLPTLAERPEDLPLLIRHFLDRFGSEFGRHELRLAPRAQRLMIRYSWPGNVRELEGVLRYGSMVAESGVIDVSDLPKWWLDAIVDETTNPSATMHGTGSMDEVRYEHAVAVLEECGGNRLRAAAQLGIARATLYRLLKKRS